MCVNTLSMQPPLAPTRIVRDGGRPLPLVDEMSD